MCISFDGIPSKPYECFGLIDLIILHVFSLFMFLNVNVLVCLSFGSRKVLKSYLFSWFFCDSLIFVLRF